MCVCVFPWPPSMVPPPQMEFLSQKMCKTQFVPLTVCVYIYSDQISDRKVQISKRTFFWGENFGNMVEHFYLWYSLHLYMYIYYAGKNVERKALAKRHKWTINWDWYLENIRTIKAARRSLKLKTGLIFHGFFKFHVPETLYFLLIRIIPIFHAILKMEMFRNVSIYDILPVFSAKSIKSDSSHVLKLLILEIGGFLQKLFYVIFMDYIYIYVYNLYLSK